ncbi:MAG: RIP metalloprotease RseP [Acidimicrobiales bacterium]|nr:RIP metalloprotease RseP [Acidimicrobiales bacterium]
MLTLIAFIVALGVLIAVHEYGHYRVAVACGVKVLRFGVATLPLSPPEPGKSSIGYRILFRLSAPVYEWSSQGTAGSQGTVFAFGLFPIGGYVKMLDTREGAVEPSEAHRAFDRQPLARRAAIVAAGPLANLLLACLLYAATSWIGTQEPRAILSEPPTGSLAAQAGLRSGDLVEQVRGRGDDAVAVQSFEALRWRVVRAAVQREDLTLAVVRAGESRARDILLPLSTLSGGDVDSTLFRHIGILAPRTQPLIGAVQPGSAAARAGLQEGDRVRSAGGVPIVDGGQLRQWIREAGASGRAEPQRWVVERDGRSIELQVQPDVREDGGQSIGRIGAFVGSPPEWVTVRRGLFDGVLHGIERTWEVSALTLRVLGRMLVGEASLKNLSGPLTIADYAGKSAGLGWVQYLTFLALISVSLGVLNLLPLPVLDGGHLMYYLWEGVTGKGVPDAWLEKFQRAGVTVLLLMMSIALFNDIARLTG